MNINEIFPLINKDFDIRLKTRGIFNSLEKNIINPLAEFIFENKSDINNFYKKGDWEIIFNLKNNKINYNFLTNNNNFFEVYYIISNYK